MHATLGSWPVSYPRTLTAENTYHFWINPLFSLLSRHQRQPGFQQATAEIISKKRNADLIKLDKAITMTGAGGVGLEGVGLEIIIQCPY